MGNTTPNKIDDETRQEVIRRLEDGESPEDIKEDDAMPSRRSIYNIKKEYEKEKERQEELEREVFKDTSSAGRGDIVDALEQAGVGVKQDGDPKADVERALNAIDFDSAWDDPHYVADTLESEAGMTREWANRIVRKAYGMPDFPYVPNGRDSSGPSRPARRGRSGSGGGGPSQPPQRNQRRNGAQRGRQQGQRDQQAGQQSGSDVEQEIQQLRSTVQSLAQTVNQVAQEDQNDSQQMVTVTKNGNEVELPLHVAMQNGLLDDGDDGGDDGDFIDKLAAAKEAGLIPSQDDMQDDSDGVEEFFQKAEAFGLLGDDDAEDDAMVEMVEEMAETFQETQNAVAAQMNAAVSELAEESDDDDGALTTEELEQWWEQKQKEDKIDTLHSEIDDLKSQVRKTNRRPNSPEDDPEVYQKKIDAELERDQMETAKELLDDAPEKIAAGIRDGILPLWDRMQTANGPDSPLWQEPPSAQQQAGEFAQVEHPTAQQQSDETDDESPSAGAEDDEARPRDVSEADAEKVRERLNIEVPNQNEEQDE
jgi:hypothetical protein